MQLLERGHQKSLWRWAEMTNVEFYVFHAHKAEHRQGHSMVVVCVTQSHGLGEINDCDNSDVFRTVCLLQGLLLNSCSKSCGSGKKERFCPVRPQSPTALTGERRESLRAVGDFTVSPLWLSPFEASKMLKVCHVQWVFIALALGTIKIHLLHSCVKGS